MPTEPLYIEKKRWKNFRILEGDEKKKRIKHINLALLRLKYIEKRIKRKILNTEQLLQGTSQVECTRTFLLPFFYIYIIVVYIGHFVTQLSNIYTVFLREKKGTSKFNEGTPSVFSTDVYRSKMWIKWNTFFPLEKT